MAGAASPVAMNRQQAGIDQHASRPGIQGAGNIIDQRQPEQRLHVDVARHRRQRIGKEDQRIDLTTDRAHSPTREAAGSVVDLARRTET
jgi:hypothetical protein